MLRLVRASRVVTHRRGEHIVSRGEHLDAVYLMVEGTVSVALSAASGRTVVFATARPTTVVFGVASLAFAVRETGSMALKGPSSPTFPTVASSAGRISRWWSQNRRGPRRGFESEARGRARVPVTSITQSRFDGPGAACGSLPPTLCKVLIR
jgi:Cyclic nucleotide-binding domain